MTDLIIGMLIGIVCAFVLFFIYLVISKFRDSKAYKENTRKIYKMKAKQSEWFLGEYPAIPQDDEITSNEKEKI